MVPKVTDTPKQLSSESQQFATITLVTGILFLTVGSLAVILGIIFVSPVARGLGVAIVFVILPLAVTAHLQVKKDNLDRAVALVTTIWYLISCGMIIVGDRL